MEPRRQFKTWVLFCLAAFIICLDSRVYAEKKRLYIKTEPNPKQQVHHHHYYTISDPMFGSSRNHPMKSRPEPEDVFDRVRFNRASPSNRFMDYYHDHPVHTDYPLPSQPDHYHDDFDPYTHPEAARLVRMSPPPIQPYLRHQQPDIPEDSMPSKSTRRVPTYHVSPDIYSQEFQRPFFSQNTDKHPNVRHVYTSEVVEDDY